MNPLITHGNFEIDNNIYELNRILVDEKNYIEVRELEKAGFKIDFDAERNMPMITSPSIQNKLALTENRDSILKQVSMQAPTEIPISVPKITDEEKTLLYLLVCSESRGEDQKGQTLVANVVLNRTKDHAFPNSIKDVIFQVNQFSSVMSGQIYKMQPTIDLKKAVQEVLDGKDESQGALYFRSIKGLDGSWHKKTLTQLFVHGSHAFFK